MMEIPAFLKPDYYKKDTVAGINVGTASVKAAIFRQSGVALELVKADLREEESVSGLKDLLKSVNPRTTRFVATVNCPHTAVRRIKAPRIPRAEIREAIRLHAAQYFPFPIDKSYVDFEWLAEDAKENLLVAVSPEATVRRMMDLAADAGIKLASVVPTPLAMARSLPAGDSRVLAILDVGHSLTELVIVKDRELLFSRTIPVAGKDFTGGLTVSLATEKGRLELSMEDAERIKRLVGVPSEGEAPQMIEDKISTTQILSMLRAPIELLSSEIERCFDYYREESGGGKIDALLLYGGGAGLKGFDRVLSARLGIETQVGEGHRFEAAQGAARSLTLGQTINLLPPEVKEETKRTFKRASLLSVAASAILFLIFIYVGMAIQLNNARTQAATAEKEIASLKPELEEVSKQRLADELLRDEPYWDEVFRGFATATPPGVVLTRLRFQDKAFFLTGSVALGDRQAQVAHFIRNLEEGAFAHVRLVTARDGGPESGNQFEIRCGMDSWK